jgi:general secretion pathway protein C
MQNPIQATDLGKVLGMQAQANTPAEKAAPSTASRLSLIGVAKSGSRDMVALIAVDGQAAKPFARGAEVLPGLVLQSVSLQKASLGASLASPSSLQLDMPHRPEAATGSLP